MNPQNIYRSEVEIPINENNKKNVKKSLSEEDKKEFQEPLKEGYVLFNKSINSIIIFNKYI